MPTHHEKISIWRVRPCSDEQIDAALASMDGLRNKSNRHAVIDALKAIVPEFQPENNH